VNPYLTRLREQYTAIQTSIEGLQTRAAEADKDLTADELRSIQEQAETAKALHTQITLLTEQETRSAAVADMAAKVGASAETGMQTRAVGGAKTQDRDPGIYTRGGQHSFMADQFRAAKMNDPEAKDRLVRHSNALRDNVELRAMTGAGTGSGLVPPVWLAEQYAPILHRRLRVASVVRQVPFAGPYAWTIPIATVGSTVSNQTEGTNTTTSDQTDTTITVTPTTVTGFADVSRQLVEASNPAVDAILWADLVGSFYDQCETNFITTLAAQASVNAVTIADGAVAAGARNGLLDAISAVSDNNAGDADYFCGRTSRWTPYLKLLDSAGRPLVLSQQYTPMNNVGVGDVTRAYANPVQGSMEGINVVTSPTIAANLGFVINSQELLFSNSNPMQFKFEETNGPALIRVGVWGYMAAVTARRPKAITKITYTAN